MTSIAKNTVKVVGVVAALVIVFFALVFGMSALSNHSGSAGHSDVQVGVTYTGKVGMDVGNGVVVPFSGGAAQPGFH